MEDSTSYVLTRLFFQRGLALVYLIAFLALLNQFKALLGEKGLLPVEQFVSRVGFFDSPSIFFAFPKDFAFSLFAWIGVLLSLLALSGFSERFGTGVSMAVWGFLWLFYLSFVNVGQTFYGFGWESMLLEAGFLAMFLGGAQSQPPVVVIWLIRWLLFRVMFGAGLIKLRGDSCWRDLTCLFYHYETQPMPNPLSWYFHWLPQWVHKSGVLFNHFVELIVPFGYFALQPIAAIAGGFTILLQGMLMVSGNLSFLNLLTIVLAISAFDDRMLGKLFSLSLPSLQPLPIWHTGLTYALALLVVVLSVKPIQNMLSPRQMMNASFDPLHLVGTYGAFGSVTRPRLEVVIEGTQDPALSASTRWREYEFKGKPGNPARRPPQIAPYHLRLDWLMWFEALNAGSGNQFYSPWFFHFMAKLLQNDEQTVKLIRVNPFSEKSPTYIRALLYEYRFTTRQEKTKTGAWWHRKLLGTYFPPVSLTDPTFLQVLKNQGWWEENR